jgi:bifunctional non-homologous end joining protein LigD
MICVYSLRAREKPIVSFPLEWGKLEDAAELGDPERLQVTHAEALSGVEEKEDLFREVLMKEQKLPHI